MKKLMYLILSALVLSAGCSKNEDKEKTPPEPDPDPIVWDGSSVTEPADLDAMAKTATIARVSDLAWLSQECNASLNTFEGWVFTLGADFDLNDKPWTPIGQWSDENGAIFKGAFDGNGHAIKGLHVDFPDRINNGLFGVAQQAVIKNLQVTGNVKGSIQTAGICANVQAGTLIENCSFSGTVANYGSGGQVGGIGGWVESSTITGCHSSATIGYGGENPCIGGVASYLINSEVSNCSFEGRFEPAGDLSGLGLFGGIAGRMDAKSVISGCRNTADLAVRKLETAVIGGIVGYISNATLAACYNTGAVANQASKVGYTGGIFGSTDDSDSQVFACYNIGALTLAPDEAASAVRANYEINRWRGDKTVISACYHKVESYYDVPGIKQFSQTDWPQDDGDAGWGIGNNPEQGKYWKDLGSFGTQTYPTLWWE